MNLIEKAKYGRKALLFQQMSEDELNNKIYDLKEKYRMSDDDLATINIAISTITSRRVMEQLK